MSKGNWNYRIVKCLDGFLALHEVYYDAEGRPWSMTSSPTDFVTADEEGGKEELIRSIEMALNDAKNRPVLDEPNEWPGKAP